MPGSAPQLKVAVWRGSSPLTLFLDGDSSSAKTKIIYNPFATAENITVGRSGAEGSSSCGWWYAMSGNQTAILEELQDPKVQALKTFVSAGDSVTFVASFPDSLDNHWMAFYGGDTLPTPKGYSGYTVISSCFNKKSCTVPVSVSGRMYLRLGNTTGGVVHYPSPIVWVGKNPSEVMTLTCAPVYVMPSDSTRCTAGSTGTSSPQVAEWFFVAAPNSVVTTIASCGTAMTCAFPVTDSGFVHVRANLSNLSQTANHQIHLMANGCPAHIDPSITPPVGDCKTPTPAEMQHIYSTMMDEYHPSKTGMCTTILERAQEHFFHDPVFIFDTSTEDYVNNEGYWVRLAGVTYYGSSSRPVIGIRRMLLSGTLQAHAGPTFFHEAAHELVGYVNEDDASYYEEKCKKSYTQPYTDR